jgi:hypothetical protein
MCGDLSVARVGEDKSVRPTSVLLRGGSVAHWSYPDSGLTIAGHRDFMNRALGKLESTWARAESFASSSQLYIAV